MPSVYHNRSFAISQGITAGNDFDGTAPAGTPTWADDTVKYAAEAAGGLFEPFADVTFDPASPVLALVGIVLALSGQSAWSLYLVDADAKEVLIYTGGAESAWVATEEEKVVLLPGSKLKLTSTGASGVLKAVLTFEPRGQK